MANYERLDATRSQLPDNYPTTRPEAVPGQVLSPEEIVLGGRYVRMHNGVLSKVLLSATSEPFISQVYDNALAFAVSEITPSLKHAGAHYTIPLADVGVVPYSTGLWNPSNRLVRASEATQGQ